MHRLIASLSTLGLLAAMIGCNHTAGVCDCDTSTYGCGGCCGNCGTSGTQMGCCPPGANHLAPVPSGVMVPKAPEPIKEMPKENGAKPDQPKEQPKDPSM